MKFLLSMLVLMQFNVLERADIHALFKDVNCMGGTILSCVIRISPSRGATVNAQTLNVAIRNGHKHILIKVTSPCK